MASPPFRGGSEHHLESHSTTNPNSTGGRPPAAQLEFSQAMTDFKVMFPDMDAEVIEAVLRANNGAVDATIDHLLTMSADNEAEKLLHEEPTSGAISKKGRGHFSANYFHLDYLAYLINNIYSPPQVQKQPGRAAAEVHISNSFSYVFFNILFS